MKSRKTVNDYKPISDRQLELMNDSQLIVTRNILKMDLSGGKADPDGLMLSDYNRVCVRMSDRLEHCYAFGLIPGRADSSGRANIQESLDCVVSLKAEIEKLREDNRRLVFELTGVEPEFFLSEGPEPELPFHYPDSPDELPESMLEDMDTANPGNVLIV